MSTKVLFFSVGTSAEPIIQTIDDQLSKEKPENLKVFLVYGRQIENQKETPLEIVTKIKQHFSKQQLHFYSEELPDPQNIEKAVACFEEILAKCLRDQPKELIVDFTGGTKVMSAALFYAAIMTTTNTNLSFSYVGGKRIGQNGRVTTDAINIYNAEVVNWHQYKKIYDQLKNHHYPQAFILAEQLPGSPRNNFIKRAVAIFSNYDALRYQKAQSSLHQLEILDLVAESTSPLLKKITANLRRLRELLHQVVPVYSTLKKISTQQCEIGAKKQFNHAALLVADYLCNAERRIAQGLYDEAILRIYRALETAIQIALLRLNVNPWKPNWQRMNEKLLETYKEKLKTKTLPEQLSFFNGLLLLDSLLEKSIFTDDIHTKVKKITNLRNFSYLEHGYENRSKENANSCLEDSLSVATIILNEDISSYLKNNQIVWG